MRTFGQIATRRWLTSSLLLAAMVGAYGTTLCGQEPAAETPPAPAAVASEEAAAPATAETPASSEAPKSDATAPADATPPASTDEAASSEAPKADESTASAEATSEATAAPAADDATVEDASTKESAMPAGKTQPSIAEEVAGGDKANVDTATGETAADGTQPGVDEGPGTVAESSTSFLLAAGLVALFVIPILLGNYLARVWKMPDHAWKFSLIIGVMAASIVIIWFGRFKFGPDLAGGITLVYELANAESQPEADQPKQPEADAAASQSGVSETDAAMNELIGALKRRLDPDGTKEITIRKYGPAIEIIIPEMGQDEMAFVKRRITDMGQLEFRITADPAMSSDRDEIERAKLMPPSQKVLTDAKGNKIAEWVAYDVNEFGPIDEPGRIVKRAAGKTPEALVLIDPMNVTGGYLTSSSKGPDDRGGSAVHFTFDAEGARRFGQLTGQNLPNVAQENLFRHLGIILDKRLLSAPDIRSRITTNGQISGGNMTEREVEHIIEILNAGKLPLMLNKEPISEWTISPTLGSETIEQGKVAILASLGAVVLFMIVYYRSAGVIACIALTFNLLLVLALMVLIKAAFTLPGLAGLVLTIGMAVDANVLIYERIREELSSGAALRMAIRNGFGRAMSAIIDSNVTTIIAGVALYYIGTDQVKGFAVTLILGILTSMFTAIFFARVVFDVAERRGWLKQLRMMKLMATPNYDFLRVKWIAAGLSLVLIAIGLVAVYGRGSRMLDIDFTGGSSVTFQLKPTASMPIDEVRETLEQSDLAEKNLVIVRLGAENERYTIDSSATVEDVKQIIADKFGDKLMKFSFAYEDLKPYDEGDVKGSEATLLVNTGNDYSGSDGMSYDATMDALQSALNETNHSDIRPTISNDDYRLGSAARFQKWQLQLVGLEPEATRAVLDHLQTEMNQQPLFPMANNIGGRVSSDMQTKAFLAILVSLIGVIGYLWIRFQHVTYGLAAGVALVHDVLVTIGMMALSGYIVQAVPGLASVLQLDAFQINLTIVAALLTIIGYSLNDTIVTFDRLREIKGKSPNLTPEMINSAVNQTLSRTILTATTVFLVVVILYFFGGEGIHSFAFAFLIGVIAGTYSTIFIAAPVLLWLDGIGRRYFSGASSKSPAAAARGRLTEATR